MRSCDHPLAGIHQLSLGSTPSCPPSDFGWDHLSPDGNQELLPSPHGATFERSFNITPLAVTRLRPGFLRLKLDVRCSSPYAFRCPDQGQRKIHVNYNTHRYPMAALYETYNPPESWVNVADLDNAIRGRITATPPPPYPLEETERADEWAFVSSRRSAGLSKP